jgi:hypothetical protein
VLGSILVALDADELPTLLPPSLAEFLRYRVAGD